jgi:hypothetical protein
MSTSAPLVSAIGIWYAYLEQTNYPGNGESYVAELSEGEKYGNESLFDDQVSGVSLTHRSVVNVDVHASCAHEVAIERTLGVRLDKQGAILERGQSIFVAGCGNAAYQGILDEGTVIGTFVSAPGDSVNIKDGYISVTAQPI